MKKCIPCEDKSVVPLTNDEITNELLKIPGWSVVNKQLMKKFSFADFVSAMDFANRITDIAEEEGHHPDLRISYGTVEVTTSTHSLGALTHNDFILAQRISLVV
jgi:4a-hydroxytetrahydrobiopterin dehydratase